MEQKEPNQKYAIDTQLKYEPQTKEKVAENNTNLLDSIVSLYKNNPVIWAR